MRQAGREILAEPVREVVAGGILGLILEGKHDECRPAAKSRDGLRQIDNRKCRGALGAVGLIGNDLEHAHWMRDVLEEQLTDRTKAYLEVAAYGVVDLIRD